MYHTSLPGKTVHFDHIPITVRYKFDPLVVANSSDPDDHHEYVDSEGNPRKEKVTDGSYCGTFSNVLKYMGWFFLALAILFVVLAILTLIIALATAKRSKRKYSK